MQEKPRKRGRPKGRKNTDPAGTILALDRSLDVLEALADHEGMTLTELADYLDQSPATIYRILTTLESRSYVEGNKQKQEWFVGPQTFRLGSAFLRRANIIEQSRPIMRELMAKTGETSNLGIEREGAVLFVSQVETHNTIRAFFPPGTRSPLHASGIGKALLAHFSEERLEQFLKTVDFTPYTDKTIINVAQLRSAIETTRKNGYSFDDEERTIGMRCVAAAIVNNYGEVVAGVSISGPTMRMADENIAAIGKMVVTAAQKISQRLGFVVHDSQPKLKSS